MNRSFEVYRRENQKGNIDFLNDEIRVALINTAVYTPDFVNDATVEADVPGAAILTEAVLAGKAVLANGAADAADFDTTFPDPGGGGVGSALLFYKYDAGGSSIPMWWFDTGVTGLPVTLDESDDSVLFNALGIYVITTPA